MSENGLSFRTQLGVPDEWDDLVEPSSPFAGSRWRKMFVPKTPGEYISFLVSGPEHTEVGAFGIVSETSECPDTMNVWSILFGECSAFQPHTSVLGQLRQVKESAPSKEEWFPNLILISAGEPGMPPVGPGSTDNFTIEILLDGIVSWARREGLRSVSFLYTDPSAETLRKQLEAMGFYAWPITSRADLEVPGSSFSDYAATLSSNGRSNLRKERRRLRESGVTTQLFTLTESVEDLVELRCAHRRKYGRPADETEERTWLRELSDDFGERLLVWIATIDETPLSFSLFVRDGETLHAFLNGADYEDDRSRLAYFDTTFYTPVEDSYELEISRIMYGLGVDGAKRGRGCQLVGVDGWIFPLAATIENSVFEATQAAQHGLEISAKPVP